MTTKQAAKHTPGPWEIVSHQRASLCEASIEVHSLNGRQVCDMGDYPNDEDKTNARLIAAAPDLLQALKDIVKRVGPPAYSDTEVAVVNIAENAITKAEGK